MAIVEQDAQAVEEAPSVNYLNNGYGLKSWLLTKDHKRIAVLYIISISIFFALGGVFASLIRLELLTPAGDLMSSDTYNKLFSMHGIIMVFFFLVPLLPLSFAKSAPVILSLGGATLAIFICLPEYFFPAPFRPDVYVDSLKMNEKLLHLSLEIR